MKTILNLVIAILIIFIYSCNKDKEQIETNVQSKLLIEIGDSIKLLPQDIAYFDSSTNILFLKDKIKVNVGVGRPPVSCTTFRIIADVDTLVKGVIYPDRDFQSMPLSPTYISSRTYPLLQTDILPIMRFFRGKNHDRFIEVFKLNNILKSGITCTIDSLKRSGINDTILSGVITYRNFDEISYYVPDPTKMGEDFHSWGFVNLVNKQDNKLFESISNVWITSAWNWKLDYLGILPAKGKVSFHFLIPYAHKVEPGDYNYYFSMDNNAHFLPFSISLDQNNSRVWVGTIYSSGNVKLNNLDKDNK